MKLTLMIEGSKEAIAAVLAALPADAVPAVVNVSNQPGPVQSSPPQPSPAPLAAAPTAPALPVPNAGSDEGDDSGPMNLTAPEVDSTGIRWDERIHSANKATTGDGKWRKRRGVDAGTVAAVEAELRNAAPVPIPQPPLQPVQPTPPPVPMMQMPQQQPALQPAPLPMPVPPPQQAVQQATQGTALDFAGFMAAISPKMGQMDAAGKPIIHADYLAQVTGEINQAFGAQLSSITDIANNPQMISYAVQILQRDGKW